MNIDDNVPCYAEFDDTEESIVDEMIAKRQLLDDTDDTDDTDNSEDDTEPYRIVTRSEARSAIDIPRGYFIRQGFSEEKHASLDVCALAVFERQLVLDRVFNSFL
jgi:hypothetical protein